jgi:hypothetical protein
MNPQKNYNLYPNARNNAGVTLATPVLDRYGRMNCFFNRFYKKDKTRDIKKYKNLGIEEDVRGYCRRCDLIRPFARKHPSNVHYNCLVTNCCTLLHQWDVCNYCFVDVHRPQPKYDDQARRDEVARFHHVFSQLPDELKRYVSEYVPTVFKYIEMAYRVVYTRKLATIDTLVKTLPLNKWRSVVPLFKKYHMKNHVNKSSSRQQICNGVKELYKNLYKQYTKSLVDESDFWTHKHVYSRKHNTENTVLTLAVVDVFL